METTKTPMELTSAETRSLSKKAFRVTMPPRDEFTRPLETAGTTLCLGALINLLISHTE